jgi:CheY-like chemotaxis protein/HPt (histidine-containing phosphotransfer) domain-containing protein
MSNDFLQNIFKPFIQEDSSFSRSHGGTGLGLAISKNIIEKCGGNLFVESNKNKGSKFSFELSFPICYTSSKKSGTQTTSSDQFNSNLRILVAEDNVLNQQLIIALLEKANLDHVVVNDGIDALKVLQKESFDLVLMDIQMPRMDGLTTLRHIRESLQLDIPVVALTANATKEDQERFINAGMNGYLSKPYKKDDLFQLIRNLSTQPVEKEKSEPTLFSIKTISELAGGDQSFINSIVQSFIIETPVKLFAIEKAIETEDAQAVAFQTHQLKSMVDILEIYITSDLVKQMERESKKEVNDWTLIESLYIDVKNTLLETIEQLKSL